MTGCISPGEINGYCSDSFGKETSAVPAVCGVMGGCRAGTARAWGRCGVPREQRPELRGRHLLSPCGGWPVPEGRGAAAGCIQSLGSPSCRGASLALARRLLSGKSQSIPDCVKGRDSAASRALPCPHQSEHSLRLKRTLFKISDDTDCPRCHSTRCPSTRSPCPGQPQLTAVPVIPYGNTTRTDLLLHG